VDMKWFLMWFVGSSGTGADARSRRGFVPALRGFVPTRARFVTFSGFWLVREACGGSKEAELR